MIDIGRMRLRGVLVDSCHVGGLVVGGVFGECWWGGRGDHGMWKEGLRMMLRRLVCCV